MIKFKNVLFMAIAMFIAYIPIMIPSEPIILTTIIIGMCAILIVVYSILKLLFS